jgi:hypothetical protein
MNKMFDFQCYNFSENDVKYVCRLAFLISPCLTTQCLVQPLFVATIPGHPGLGLTACAPTCPTQPKTTSSTWHCKQQVNEFLLYAPFPNSPHCYDGNKVNAEIDGSRLQH